MITCTKRKTGKANTDTASLYNYVYIVFSDETIPSAGFGFTGGRGGLDLLASCCGFLYSFAFTAGLGDGSGGIGFLCLFPMGE